MKTIKSAKKKPPKPAGKKSANPAKKGQTKKVVGLFGFIARLIGDAMDPVCQTKDALILGKYKGYCVRMVPVVDGTGHVERWIPDADKVKLIDSMLAAGKIPDISATMRAGAPPAQLPTAPQTTASVQSAPPVLPPSTCGSPPQPAFNPQGIPGI